MNIGVKQFFGIYLTINTLSLNEGFDLNDLLKTISAKSIYIGLPDPKLNYYKSDDPVVLMSNINRYPDNLQKIILEQNFTAFSNSRQNIQFSPYYSDIRISKLMQTELKKTRHLYK